MTGRRQWQLHCGRTREGTGCARAWPSTQAQHVLGPEAVCDGLGWRRLVRLLLLLGVARTRPADRAVLRRGQSSGTCSTRSSTRAPRARDGGRAVDRDRDEGWRRHGDEIDLPASARRRRARELAPRTRRPLVRHWHARRGTRDDVDARGPTRRSARPPAAPPRDVPATSRGVRDSAASGVGWQRDDADAREAAMGPVEDSTAPSVRIKPLDSEDSRLSVDPRPWRARGAHASTTAARSSATSSAPERRHRRPPHPRRCGAGHVADVAGARRGRFRPRPAPTAHSGAGGDARAAPSVPGGPHRRGRRNCRERVCIMDADLPMSARRAGPVPPSSTGATAARVRASAPPRATATRVGRRCRHVRRATTRGTTALAIRSEPPVDIEWRRPGEYEVRACDPAPPRP